MASLAASRLARSPGLLPLVRPPYPLPGRAPGAHSRWPSSIATFENIFYD